MRRALSIVLAATFALATGPVLAQGAEADFIENFNGKFSGGGKVRTEAHSNPWNVSCNVTGNSSDNSINFEGTCRAALIVSRKIGAQLTVGPNGTYSGTYIGSKIGPAHIEGKRKGDTVTLMVTWPEPVNGDTEAVMSITNTGNGFVFTVDDLDQPGGQMVRMTEIQLNR